MNTMSNSFPRGSLWRQWDLHIHTPASFHWNGKQFRDTTSHEEKAALVDEMIAALNSAEPIAYALMDYWTFDGWFALKKRLAAPNAPLLNKTVFPGIELRLAAPMRGRLNAHAIFSDTINDQQLKDFKGQLILELINKPLSDHSLIEYARYLQSDKLKFHGFDKHDVDSDDRVALLAGSHTAEINCDSYKRAISSLCPSSDKLRQMLA